MPQGIYQTAVVLGKDAKVRLNAVVLGVRSGSIRESAADHEVGDTEDAAIGGASVVGYEAHFGGRRVADVTVEWIFTFGLVPISTLNIFAGSQIVNLTIYPKGLSYQAWTFPYFEILQTEQANIDINQPVTGRFSGKMVGSYTGPTS